MKTILVPTDFSFSANNALNYAVKLAKKEHSKILLLHVFHVPYPIVEHPMDMAIQENITTRKETEKQIKLLAEKIKKLHIDCDSYIEEGVLVDVVLDVVKKKKVDFIVMGTRGSSGLSEIFMGSNASNVIGKVTCPVIAVPEDAIFNDLKKIVYATDYNSADITNLKYLVEISKVFKSSIEIVHVVDNDILTEQEQEEKMEKLKRKISSKINNTKLSYKVLFDSNIEEKLEHYLLTKNSSLLATSTEQGGFFENLFKSSFTKKLVCHTKIPLLAFHHKKTSEVFI